MGSCAIHVFELEVQIKPVPWNFFSFKQQLDGPGSPLRTASTAVAAGTTGIRTPGGASGLTVVVV